MLTLLTSKTPNLYNLKFKKRTKKARDSLHIYWTCSLVIVASELTS